MITFMLDFIVSMTMLVKPIATTKLFLDRKILLKKVLREQELNPGPLCPDLSPPQLFRANETSPFGAFCKL